MKYKCDDIVMVHKHRLMEDETLSIGINLDKGANKMGASSSFFVHLLTMFNTSDNEVTLEISKDKIVVKNYTPGTPCRPKMMRSQINLNPTEFLSFHISRETSLNFSLKAFRTVIHFAESFNLNMELNFEVGGKPLLILMKNPTFEVNFIVATVNPANDGSSVVTVPSLVNMNLKPVAMETDDIEVFGCQLSNSKDSSFELLMLEARNKRRRSNEQQNTIEKERKGENINEITPPVLSERAKLVFGRCFEATFVETINPSNILAPNSDSE